MTSGQWLDEAGHSPNQSPQTNNKTEVCKFLQKEEILQNLSAANKFWRQHRFSKLANITILSPPHFPF